MIGDALMAAIYGASWFHWSRCDRRLPLPWGACLFLAVWYVGCAVMGIVLRLPLTGAVGCAEAGYWAHLAWKRHPPRERRPSKALGRVRDLGHRLVVQS